MEEYTFTLTSEESTQIAASIGETALDTDMQSDKGRAFFQARRLFNRFPDRFTKRVFDFKSRGEPFLLIKGFNLEQDLRQTPQTRGEVSHAPDYYKKLLMAVSSDVGYMFRYAAKPKHDFIDDVLPVKQDKEKQLGTNSIFLDWHVEDAFHPVRPDYVGLFCIRGDRNAQTLIFDAKTYVNHTEGSPDIAKYKYKLIADGTFQSGEEYSTEMPVLENSMDPQITFDPSFMIAYAEEAESALRRFGEFVDKNHHVITLEPGDLLIFDNRRVAHSRTAYHPKFDGSNRWLIRSLIIESTWKFKDFASTHPFVIGEKKTWQA